MCAHLKEPRGRGGKTHENRGKGGEESRATAPGIHHTSRLQRKNTSEQFVFFSRFHDGNAATSQLRHDATHHRWWSTAKKWSRFVKLRRHSAKSTAPLSALANVSPPRPAFTCAGCVRFPFNKHDPRIITFRQGHEAPGRVEVGDQAQAACSRRIHSEAARGTPSHDIA